MELQFLDSTTRVPGQTLTGVEKRYRTQWIVAMHAVMQNVSIVLLPAMAACCLGRVVLGLPCRESRAVGDSSSPGIVSTFEADPPPFAASSPRALLPETAEVRGGAGTKVGRRVSHQEPGSCWYGYHLREEQRFPVLLGVRYLPQQEQMHGSFSSSTSIFQWHCLTIRRWFTKADAYPSKGGGGSYPAAVLSARSALVFDPFQSREVLQMSLAQ